MEEAKARQLLTTYKLAEASFDQFTRFKAETGDFLISKAADLAHVTTLENLRKIATFVDVDAATGGLRGRQLLRVGRITGKGCIDIPANNGLLTSGVTQKQLDDLLSDWSVSEQAAFSTFMQARTRAAPGQHPAKILTDVLPVTATIGMLRTDIVDVMKLITASGDRCTLNLKEGNLVGAIRVKNAFPAARFTGFTRWGEGDAADHQPATNLSNHFKKHVCNSSGEYAVEARWWWRALQIQVRAADVPPPALSPVENGYFTGPGGTQDPRRLDPFIENVVRPRPALIEALRVAFESAYRDYALKLSRELSGVIAEANGDKVMVSGYTGNATIFGRYDDANAPASELGISSCYFVEAGQRKAKLTPDKPNRLWVMR
ncbi:hypothetical protein HLB44_32485 [Aquincola sp. S2]|uniref:Uncharacterized protein n=1 Tax=Pseudaquabacterium terrae TaxID=2732868 RepID=A0ABX2ESS8_9BURK|nr:hypothetical protein [Aquabacterium terrae]NRF71716.1 hypothetical protein [Aquabacterium terrae]